MSGTGVAALVSSYDAVLQKDLRAVTGDPAALRVAATRCGQWSRSLSGYQQAVDSEARQLGSDWSGEAYQACLSAATQNADEAGSAASRLAYAEQRLTDQAGALENATGTQRQIIDWFDGNGRMYVSLAQASGADQAAIAARVHEIGKQALDMSAQNKLQLGRMLAGPKATGLTVYDPSRTYAAGVDGVHGSSLYGADGEARVGPRISGNLQVGKLLGGQGKKLLKGTAEADLLKAHGSAFVSDGGSDLVGDGRLTVGADGRLAIGGGNGLAADANAGVSGSLSVSSTDHFGHMAVTSRTEADARAGLHGQLGRAADGSYGAHGELGATAGVTQTESASVGGLKLAVSGGVTTGIGGQAGLGVGYDQGHLTFDVNAGATLGDGVRGGLALDVDVPKIAGEVGDAAAYVWHGAENAASAAGGAVGAAWTALVGQ